MVTQVQTASSSRSILYVIIAVILGILVYAVLTKPDTRNPVQKVGDAIQKEDTRELKDRTPADRIGDAVKDGANTVTPPASQQ